MEKSRLGINQRDQKGESGASKGNTNNNNAAQNNMIHYETFESSSGDEMSRCMFESQALSF